MVQGMQLRRRLNGECEEYYIIDRCYRAEGKKRERIRVLSETDGGVEEEDVLCAEGD